ncbi:MAG: DUF4143 domain-containing protein, partial [Myxococcaceae bacterium]|nr:DUF4143 domain-containing protein [Myxococcaceae bacterium]
GGSLSYWRTPSGSEVDFIWSRGKKQVAIEVKASTRWRSEEGYALKEFVRAQKGTKGYVIYLGKQPLRDEELSVLPLNEALNRLNQGELIG